MRPLLVLVHRYVGLVMAGFLLIAGLTGALLVWYHELDTALNPKLMRVIAPPSAGPGTAPGPLLDPLVLRESVLAAYPGSRLNFLSFLQARPEDARQIYIEGEPDASGEPRQLAADEVFVNPYTGEILGDRRWGDISQGLTNLMPFLYRLHYSLALDTIGTWAFGIVALLWTIDCFVGAWLTFPARVGGASRMPRSWWSRWKPAWKVRWQGGAYKINFDLHRAGGLWPWAMLFVLAWSSVAFNLYEPVYRPAMGTVFEFQSDPRDSLPKLAREAPEPSLGWVVALDIARLHLQREAAARHIVVMSADRASYDPQKGYLRYVARTDRDLNERRGQSAVFIDTRTGRLLATVFPTGEASGDTLTTWLTTLHMAQIWGLPFRVFVTLVGVAVAVLSGTGVVIWWKKRAARAAPLKKPLRNGNDSAGHPTGV